jgi:hypothetical protein
MPFMLAHPAAIVPLARLLNLARASLPLSALIVGSMAPDVPHFVPHFVRLIHFLGLPSGKHFGHTFAGTFLLCIPAGLFALWLFHVVLKAPFLSLLPFAERGRLAPVAASFRFGPPRHFLLIIVALASGAFTHIIWDSFSHVSGWPVQQFSILHAPIMQTARGPIFVFNLVQRVSTLMGAALLAYWCRQWLKQAPAQAIGSPVSLAGGGSSYPGIFMAVAAFILAGIYSYWKSPVFFRLSWHQPFARRLVIAGCAVAGAELFIFSLAWHWKALKSRPIGIISHQPTA